MENWELTDKEIDQVNAVPFCRGKSFDARGYAKAVVKAQLAKFAEVKDEQMGEMIAKGIEDSYDGFRSVAHSPGGVTTWEYMAQSILSLLQPMILAREYRGYCKAKVELCKEAGEAYALGSKHGSEISTEKAVAQAKEERERIFDRLDIYENDLGFCEISNHIPYSELQSLKHGE